MTTRPLLLVACALILGILVGDRFHLFGASPLPKLPPARGSVVGRVSGIPRVNADGTSLVLDALRPVKGQIRLRCLGSVPELLPGDWVEADVVLHPPRGYRNPGATNVERQLRARGFVAIATMTPPHALRLVAHGSLSLLRAIAALRLRLAKDLSSHLHGDARALVGALAIGERSGIPPDLEQAFRKAGVSHLLSVSGLHLAAVVLLTYVLLRRILARAGSLPLLVSTRRLAALSTIPLAAFYAALCGADIPVVRSAIVAVVLLGAVIAKRRSDGATSLAIAALGILAADPVALFEPAFQLSFAACVGLLLAPRPQSRGLVGGVLSLASITLAASLFTAPLVARHFGELPLAGALANLLCVPLTTFLLLPAALLGTLLLGVWPTAAHVLLGAAGLASEALAFLARVFADAPGAALPVGEPNLVEMFLAWAGAAWLLRGRWSWAAGTCGLLAVVVGTSIAARRLSNDVRVTFLDVGQGDAVLVELPQGRTLLVDGGGSFEGGPEVGEAALLPFLRHRRILQLDVVALSHPHPDHFGGLAAVVGKLPVGEFWTSGEPSSHPQFVSLLEKLRNHAVPLRLAHRWSVGAAVVEPLHPQPHWEPALSTNDNSLVLRVRVGLRAVLLTGDLEAEGEWILAADAPRADVLKVPHHGSRTSSTPELLAAVKPRLAIASLGVQNRFGFPHAEVSKRYAQAHIRLLRTDRDGAVTVRMNKNGMTAQTTNAKQEIRMGKTH